MPALRGRRGAALVLAAMFALAEVPSGAALTASVQPSGRYIVEQHQLDDYGVPEPVSLNETCVPPHPLGRRRELRWSLGRQQHQLHGRARTPDSPDPPPPPASTHRSDRPLPPGAHPHAHLACRGLWRR